ncbi:MAG: DinB family protein [Bacteroidota bacterium]
MSLKIQITRLIEGIGQSPEILHELITSIPESRLKQKLIPNKWSIHEHVCHLAMAEEMIIRRFRDFKDRPNPQFQSYQPNDRSDYDKLMHLDMWNYLDRYKDIRHQTIELIKNFDARIWRKEATHEEYIDYSAFIFLRHVLMHDFFHMYRIEELALTKETHLKSE